MPEKRIKGKILSDDAKETYGFLSHYESGKRKKTFFPLSQLPEKIKNLDKKEQRKYLNDNAIWEYGIAQGEKGPVAENLKYIDDRLPEDTRQLIASKGNEIENFSLRFNKAAVFDQDKFKFFEFDRKAKKARIDLDTSFLHLEFDKICRRHRETIQATGLQTTAPLRLSPQWRLIVGLGNESVYETSMTLHHIYGFPYIPASAVKGVIRSWVIQTMFSGVEEYKKDGALKDEGFCRTFGSPKESAIGEHVGVVNFFDAHPTQRPTVEPDVMTPHYSDYYMDEEGNTPPADYFDPTIIYFLTVKETSFEFLLGIKAKNNNAALIKSGKFAGRVPLALAEEWLKLALENHGLGAKTAVGYGYMCKAS